VWITFAFCMQIFGNIENNAFDIKQAEMILIMVAAILPPLCRGEAGMLSAVLRWFCCGYHSDGQMIDAIRDAVEELGWEARNQFVEDTRFRARGERCNCGCWLVVDVMSKFYPPGEYHDVAPRIGIVGVCPACLAVQDDALRSVLRSPVEAA